MRRAAAACHNSPRMAPEDRRPATYALSRCLFLRVLGLVYFAAFASLAVQIVALAGENGILPAAPFLKAVREQVGAEAYWRVPTLCHWIGASDLALKGVCVAGAVVSLLLAAGLTPVPCLILLWVLFLSAATVCRTFLHFQWDILLLETGFLAIFFAPRVVRCRLPCASEPPVLSRWLLWFLLFKLMFSSGVVKLTSGDPSWWNLRALDVHYETQPIPTWTAWYVHQMPGWFHSCCVAMMFSTELVVPFGILGPRLVRRVACVLLVGLQLVLAATGNYAYFNWLTIALCIPLLDDDAWPRRFRPKPAPPEPERAALPSELTPTISSSASAAPAWRHVSFWIAAPFAATLVILSLVDMTARFRWEVPWPAPILALGEALSSFRIVNAYGLFAVMTTERPEIVIEGSNDGQTWQAYEFKWKPGEPTRAPAFVAPHQPRLDWQMWFAALSTYRNTPWFQSFLYRLLQGSPTVLALLERNPFPDAPPRYIRSVLYDYRFTDAATRRATGAWWRREMKGFYSPAQSLRR